MGSGWPSRTVAALLLLAAVRRRWEVLRDLAIAAGGTLTVSGILILILGAAGGRPQTVTFAGYHLSFPVLHVAVAVGVGTAGLPYLARGVQRLIESILALGSPVGLPSGEELRALLTTVGLAPVSVVPTRHQTWGAAH